MLCSVLFGCGSRFSKLAVPENGIIEVSSHARRLVQQEQEQDSGGGLTVPNPVSSREVVGHGHPFSPSSSSSTVYSMLNLSLIRTTYYLSLPRLQIST